RQAAKRTPPPAPTVMPTSLAERLNAIQDRIWAMHDALLPVRLPLETFYNSLSDEQWQRQAEPQTAQRAADATDGRGRTAADGHVPTCAQPRAGSAGWIMPTI